MNEDCIMSLCTVLNCIVQYCTTEMEGVKTV